METVSITILFFCYIDYDHICPFDTFFIDVIQKSVKFSFSITQLLFIIIFTLSQKD
jgi:hypothetical protein